MSTILPRRLVVLAAAAAALTALLIAPLTALAATTGAEAAPQGIPMWMVMPLCMIFAFVAEMIVLVVRVSDDYES